MSERFSHLTPATLEADLREYLEGDGHAQGRIPTARYASFDFCFNYFQSMRELGTTSLIASPDRVEQSCLQLGFYLASWGMLRGSATLLQNSAKALEPLVTELASTPLSLWEIDANSYTDENIQALLRLAATIRRLLPGGASDTLITKIMLGVFGSVPAFDSFFKSGLRVTTFGPKALRTIGSFYSEFTSLIEDHRVPTIDFATGNPTARRYTRAKVIDMIFFIEGSRSN